VVCKAKAREKERDRRGLGCHHNACPGAMTDIAELCNGDSNVLDMDNRF